MTMMRMMMMRMMAVVLAAAVVTMLRSFMTIGSTARMTKTHPECAWTSKAHSACTKRAVWEPSCFPKSAEPSPVDPVWVWVNWLPKTWMLWYALICLGLSLYLFQDFKWNPGRISSSGVRGANIVLLDRWNHFEKKCQIWPHPQFGSYIPHLLQLHHPNPSTLTCFLRVDVPCWAKRVSSSRLSWLGKIMGFPGYSPSLRWYTLVRLFDVIWCGLLLG